MSLFRKQPQTAAPATTEERATPSPPPATPAPTPVATPAPTAALFDGARVDVAAIYKSAKLAGDELDRVGRAEELLLQLPTTASHTREVVDATFRAFGVDRTKIVSAASKQVEALEAFIRFSHDQTQRAVDTNAKRIAELEAEIDRCRKATAQATSEGEERARIVNDVLVKVQRVVDFFGDAKALPDLDDDTTVTKAPDDLKPTARAQPKATPRTTP